MRTRNNILLATFTLIFVLLITIGVSYAYFTASMTGGDETTTIEVKGGKMTITYTKGDNIELFNIIPDDNPATTKSFTVTGYNNTDVEMGYKISLVVEENTFANDSIKFKLINTTVGEDMGIPVPSITTLTDIPTGAGTIEFGIGSFNAPTNEDEIHTYDLEIYFPNQIYNQNEEQNEQIKAYVKTENYIDPCTINNCLNNHIISLADNSTATGVYNENGYRYEGSNPNNYVSFNEETWRIIGVFDADTHEITGKNLVKIMKPDSIGNYAWDTDDANNWNTSSLKAYLNGDYYTSINSASKSLIENVTWKLGGQNTAVATAETFYIAERGETIYSGSGRSTTGEGFIGLMYPSDYGYAVLEASCARTINLGLGYSQNSICYNQNWLYSGLVYWTITHDWRNSDDGWVVSSSGAVSNVTVDGGRTTRPSIYLKYNTIIISGDGTPQTPYVLGE